MPQQKFNHFMANVSVEVATLELEPYDSFIYSQSSPFSFHVDQHTVGYLTSRYIVLNCLPLAEERYMAINAQSTILKTAISENGEFLALLELQEKLLQVVIYSVPQLKKISTIILTDSQSEGGSEFQAEIPYFIEFANQNKYIILYYDTPNKVRTVLLAWQRSQIDDVFDLSNEIIRMELNRFSLKQLITQTQTNQIVFYRQNELGLQPYAASGQEQTYKLPQGVKFVKQLFINSQIAINVISNGEIIVYAPPRCIGFIQLTQEQHELNYETNMTKKSCLKGEITAAATYNNKLIIGSSAGEVILLDMSEASSASVISTLSNACESEHHTSNQGEPSFEVERKVCESFEGVDLPVFPVQVVSKSYVISMEPVKNIVFNDFYALLETETDLFIWNYKGDVFEIRKGNMQIVGMNETALQEAQATVNLATSNTSVTQSIVSQSGANFGTSETKKLSQLKFPDEDIKEVYNKILPNTIEERVIDLVGSRDKKSNNKNIKHTEHGNRDIATTGLLLTLQAACEVVGETQYFPSIQKEKEKQAFDELNRMPNMASVMQLGTLNLSQAPSIRMAPSPRQTGVQSVTREIKAGKGKNTFTKADINIPNETGMLKTQQLSGMKSTDGNTINLETQRSVSQIQALVAQSQMMTQQFRADTLDMSNALDGKMDVADLDNYDAALETAFAALRLPPYLSATSPQRLWCDILQGYPASNQPITQLKSAGSGPRFTLERQSLRPVGYRSGNINVDFRGLKTIAVSPASERLAIGVGSRIYGCCLHQGGRFQVLNCTETGQNLQKLHFCPSGQILYAQFDDGIGVYISTDEGLRQIDFKVLQGLSQVCVSNGGGIIAVVRDKGVQPLIELYRTNCGFSESFMTLKCHSAQVIHCSFAPGDTYLVTASRDGAIYGHAASDGRRVFESTLRGVSLKLVIVSYGHEIPRDFIQDEVEMAELQKKPGKNVGNFGSGKIGSDAVIAAIDEKNTLYEIAGGKQLHQILLHLEPGEKINGAVKIHGPPRVWGANYIKTVYESNVKRKKRGNTDGANATVAQFGRERAEFLDRAAYHVRGGADFVEPMTASNNNHIKDDDGVDNNKNGNRSGKRGGAVNGVGVCGEVVYEEKMDYIQAQSESYGQKAEEVVNRPIKFILFYTNQGNVECREWPIRGPERVFKIKLHSNDIIEAGVVQSSVLISGSSDQVLLSNLRYLVPVQAIFGSTVRNKCLNKLKSLYEGSGAQNSANMLIRLPVTRTLPPFSCSCSVSMPVVGASEGASAVDQLLFRLIQNLAEIHEYTGFRVSMLKEALRQKQKDFHTILAQVRRDFTDTVSAIATETKQTEEQLTVYETEFKKEHQRIYQAVQDKYGKLAKELQQQIQLVGNNIQNLETTKESDLTRLNQEREQKIAQLVNQRVILVQEKQMQVDRLDDQLSSFETAFQEEKRQIQQEREAAIEILNKIGMENAAKAKEAETALKSYNALQARKNQNLTSQIELLDKELRKLNNKEAELRAQISDIDQENQKALGQLKDADTTLLGLENDIQANKQDVAHLDKAQFVLSEKINELRAEIRPRDTLLDDMQRQQQNLQQQLEDGQAQWVTIHNLADKTKNDLDSLTKATSQAQQIARTRERQLELLKKKFERLIVENSPEQYPRCMFEVFHENEAIFNDIVNNQRANNQVQSQMSARHGISEEKGLTNELDGQKDYLHKKLAGLYGKLNEEDRKFTQLQMNSLDENSALLQESHRLKEENVQLSAQLSKIMAILQALKIKDLTQSLKQKGLYRAASVMDSQKKGLERKYDTRSISQMEGQIQDNEATIRGLLDAIDASRAQQSSRGGSPTPSRGSYSPAFTGSRTGSRSPVAVGNLGLSPMRGSRSPVRIPTKAGRK